MTAGDDPRTESVEPIAWRPVHCMIGGRCVTCDSQRQSVRARVPAESSSSCRAASGYTADLATQMVNGWCMNSIACPLMRDASTTAHRFESIAGVNPTGEDWCPCSTSCTQVVRQSIP